MDPPGPLLSVCSPIAITRWEDNEGTSVSPKPRKVFQGEGQERHGLKYVHEAEEITFSGSRLGVKGWKLFSSRLRSTWGVKKYIGSTDDSLGS